MLVAALLLVDQAQARLSDEKVEAVRRQAEFVDLQTDLQLFFGFGEAKRKESVVQDERERGESFGVPLLAEVDGGSKSMHLRHFEAHRSEHILSRLQAIVEKVDGIVERAVLVLTGIGRNLRLKGMRERHLEREQADTIVDSEPVLRDAVRFVGVVKVSAMRGIEVLIGGFLVLLRRSRIGDRSEGN